MVVFFVHRFNDIDHLTPVIYKLAVDTTEKILVLSLNLDCGIFDDFRLKYLEQFQNVRIDSLQRTKNKIFYYQILGQVICNSYVGGTFISNTQFIKRKLSLGHFSFRQVVYGVFRLFLGGINAVIRNSKVCTESIRKIYGERWANQFFDQYRPSVLVFDHAATSGKPGSMSDKSPVKDLLNIAKSRRVPTISLPHGVPLFVKHPVQYDRRKQDYARDRCDWTILQHHGWMEECREFGLDLAKVRVVGLARYCNEWASILRTIVPVDSSLINKGQNKLKVVYMDTGPDNYAERKIYAAEAIDKVAKMDFVHLIYKPHTRNNRAHLSLPSTVENAERSNSVNLVKWCDVVIGMHSSIVIEVLTQGKAYISSRYFRIEEMIHEKYGACWIVDSLEELISALEKLNKNRNYRPYSDINVRKFLTDIVYAKKDVDDVLGAYQEVISGLAKQENKVFQ